MSGKKQRSIEEELDIINKDINYIIKVIEFTENYISNNCFEEKVEKDGLLINIAILRALLDRGASAFLTRAKSSLNGSSGEAINN